MGYRVDYTLRIYVYEISGLSDLGYCVDNFLVYILSGLLLLGY